MSCLNRLVFFLSFLAIACSTEIGNDSDNEIVVFEDLDDMHEFFMNQIEDLSKVSIPNQAMIGTWNGELQSALAIDETEVVQSAFKTFIDTTAYRTTAEYFVQIIDSKDTLNLYPGSLVFNAETYGWWEYKEDLNWSKVRHQDSENDYPVTHVSWYDAQAFCKCQGKRLPSEEEWNNFAGIDSSTSTLLSDEYFGNVWHGIFPIKNLNLDGFEQLAPVKQFDKNRFGLYDMQGNVWEWTSTKSKQTGGLEYVLKGGSYLCDDSYCSGYKTETRMSASPDSSFEHVGFRCVKDVIKEDE